MDQNHPYARGATAYQRGTPWAGNPYKLGTGDRNAWNRGWEESQHADQSNWSIDPVEALKTLLENEVPAHQRVDDWEDMFDRLRDLITAPPQT